MVKPAVSGPLNGVRILDLTHVWAGPLAVRFLADLGAEVVKIEAPYGRGPQNFPAEPIGGWLGGEPGEEPWNVSAVFNKLHRNRRSVCLDLKQIEGRRLLLELVGQADVIIENFSARAMPAMGLDFATLRQANAQIIYVAMPGFGSTGPYHQRVAFGPIVEPMSGLTNMLGYDAQTPQNSAMALMDPIAATHAASAVVQALRQRNRDHEAAYIEISLHETGVAYSGPWLIDTQLGVQPQCQGNGHPQMAPHGVYACLGEDQWLALACENDGQWRQLSQLVGNLEAQWSLQYRLQNQEWIDDVLQTWTSTRDKNTAADILQSHGIPAGPVNSAPDMLADEQSKARGFFVPYERFATPMPGNPIHMQGLDSSQWQACPELGADNSSVLHEWLQYDADHIQRLYGEGLLHNKPPG
jgi:crotonobetainyl-CoA:carnitine CoA-transferase CaiB-like acyl-CoA transferase